MGLQLTSASACFSSNPRINRDRPEIPADTVQTAGFETFQNKARLTRPKPNRAGKRVSADQDRGKGRAEWNFIQC